LPLGIPNARFFADGDPKPMIEEGMRALEREEAALQAAGNARLGQGGVKLPPVNYLAVSGGGDNGAFGAGLMNGWTETGTRPEFKMVTGVSTGALIAPFAFLGSDYDATLREVYTTMTPEKVYRARGISAALFDDAMADTTPLSQVIAGYADQKMFDAIAREYQKGRLLMIGTTDLDAQRPVIWNTLDPDYSASERRTISIAGRAINTMLAASGQNDVLRTYFVTQRDGADYNLAYIGTDFKAPKTGEFDQVYMIALYQYGYQQAKDGRAWHKTPPSLETPAMVPVKP
jgi:predicted acylesterase/phospholipase RssA